MMAVQHQAIRQQPALLLCLALCCAAAASFTSVQAAECVPMCKPCVKNSECCPRPGSACGCVRNPVPGGPQLVCKCEGVSFATCISANVAATLSANKQASAGGANTTVAAKGAADGTDCLIMPPGKQPRIPCKTTSSSSGSGATAVAAPGGAAAAVPGAGAVAAPGNGSSANISSTVAKP